VYPLQFRDSIKQKGLGLTEAEMKELFSHFDVDNSGEIDYAEFRQWLIGSSDQTCLP
jgi:Ca2+-binding EF-hand superfamily protein